VKTQRTSRNIYAIGSSRRYVIVRLVSTRSVADAAVSPRAVGRLISAYLAHFYSSNDSLWYFLQLLNGSVVLYRVIWQLTWAVCSGIV